MKYCSKCGSENNDEAKFCKKCGNPLKMRTEQTQPTQQTALPIQPKTPETVGTQMTQYHTDAQVAAPTTPEEPEKKKSKAPLVISLILLVLILAVGSAVAVIYLVKNDMIDLPFLQSQDDEEDDDDDDDTDEKNEDESDSETTSDATEEETTVVEEPTTEAATTEEAEEADGKTFDNVITNEPIKLTMQVAASSELSGGDYDVKNLLDGDGDTAWVEGVKGTGKGEYVVYQAFDKEEYAFGVAIMPGYMKTQKLYDANSKPTELTVTCGDYEEVISLSDVNYQSYNDLKNTMLFYDFTQPIPTSEEITITISSAALGSKYDDTCITEMYLYTYPLYGNEKQYNSAAWEITHAGVTYGGTSSMVTDVDGYVLPGSDSTYLTMNDLRGLSADECRIARNEIYARHGRMFDDEELQDYFNSCDWYYGTTPAKNFNDNSLNDYEFANRDLIVEYEKKMGYR